MTNHCNVFDHYAAAFPHITIRQRYEEAMKSMPLDSNCGQDCQEAIDAAAALLAILLDCDEEERETIAHAVAHQCAVFICG